MSQGDIEQRTGLLRCYISRVENGHTVPSVETLEKLARAFKIPLYQLFYEGEVPAEFKRFVGVQQQSIPTQTPEMDKLARLLPDITERGRKLLYLLAKAMERNTDGKTVERQMIRERIARNGQDRRFKASVGQSERRRSARRC